MPDGRSHRRRSSEMQLEGRRLGAARELRRLRPIVARHFVSRVSDERRKPIDNAATRDYLARTFPNEAVLRGPLQ